MTVSWSPAAPFTILQSNHTGHGEEEAGYGLRVCDWQTLLCVRWASWVALVIKNSPASAKDIRDVGSIPGSGSPGVGNGNPLRYSCLENPMNRGVWCAIVHRVTRSQTQLKRLSMHLWNRQLVGACGTAPGAQLGALRWTEGWGWGGCGRRAQDGGDICTHMANKLHCTARAQHYKAVTLK